MSRNAEKTDRSTFSVDEAVSAKRSGDDVPVLVGQLTKVIGDYQEQVDDLQKKISAMRKARQALLNQTAPTPAASGPNPSDGVAPRKRERRESKAWIVRREAHAILMRERRPMNRSEMLEALRANGVVLDGATSAKLVGKILWEADEFVYKDTGYWIADEPLPGEARNSGSG